MSNIFCRLVSWYGKYLPASRIPNATVFARHDQMRKRNMKPKSLVATYQLLSGYAQNLILKVTNNEKHKLLENTGCKKDISNDGFDLNEHQCEGHAPLPTPPGSDKPLHYTLEELEQRVSMAKFAVEKHNRENGTKVEFVEFGKYGSTAEYGLKHASYLHLSFKAIDDEGKIAYLNTKVTVRRDLVEAYPLEYVSELDLSDDGVLDSRIYD
ncbi:hypothetical protein ACHQM5_013998 [Ranunculus cassubicifolius]